MRTVARDMAPSRDQGADRFRYSSDELRRARAALNFPAAIKPFYLNKSWSSLIIEEEESVPPPAGNQIVLGSTTTTFEWVDFLHEFLILPSNVYWQAAVVASIVINFFFTTYAFHFQKDLVIQVFHEMVITDILYLVDFSIALLYKYKPLLRFKLKVEKRNKFALLADAISLFPMELIYYSINGDESDIFVLYLLRMNSYIRFYRVIVFFGDLMNSVGQNQWALFFIKHILYFSILFHFFSCIWFTLGCTQDCDNVSTWTDQMEIEGDVTVWDWYINCAYFSLCTIANVGYGDLSATNQLEQFACIIAMLLGFGLTTGIFIGSLASQIVNRELRRAIFADLIYNIKKYLIDIQYEDEATKHVLAYYTILWTKKNGVKEAKNFDLLPLPLRIEICLDINYGLFHCSVLFQNLDESFLRSLSLRMKNEFYLPGDIIFYQNVAKYKMICILSGVIEILSDEDDESPMVSFTSGSCLGEIAMVLTCPSKATVRAATYTELQVLDKADFFRMMIDYPIAHQTIRSNIHDRIRLAFTRGTSIEKSAIVLTLLVSHSKVQSSIKKLKNHLHKRQGISQGEEDILEQVKKPQDDFNDSFLQLYNICENIQERDGDMCNLTSFPWIIQPNSLITTVWMHFIFSIVVMVCFIYPYYAGFERKFPTWLESLSEVADVIFIIDIYLSCTTGIEGKSGIIKRPKMILWKRMDSVGFYLDAFAVFPIEIYSLLIDDNRISVRYKSVLKLNRLLKVWQIPRYFRILEENLWVNLAFIRIMKYVLYLLLSSFWAGVALYMLACFIEPCSPGSWLTVLESVKNNRSPCTIYPCIMSVYFALVTLSRAGYGDIVPVNQQDMLLTMFNIIFGIMLFGFCIAEFTATITHKHRPRIMYQETIFAIITFMHDNNIDPFIVERVIKYFSLQWMYNQGINIRLKKKTILEDANWKLRQQVLAKERLATLNQVPLFQLADRDFLQLIISGSRVLLLPPNEIISYAGKISREMYIIQEGYCEVLNGKTGKHERKAGPGSHFGDIEMLVRVPSILTVRTITNCKVINISYPVYSQAVSMFPQIMKEINDILIDTDMNRSLRKCYHKPRSSFEDNVDVEHKPQKQHCLDLAYQYRKFKEFFARSYINVWRTCKDSSEDYWAPFKALKRFQFLKYCLFHCTISPTGGFIKVWCFLRVIAAFTVGMVYPFYWGVYPYAYSARWFITFLDVYAYIDIYLMLHVGYYNSMGLLIMHPLKTASHYIRNSFLTDILACFPFETLIPLFITVDPGELKSIARIREVRLIYCILTINRVLQIHRLVSAVQYLESNIFTRSKSIRILKFVPYTFVCINVWASLLVTLSCTYVDETMMDEATNSSMRCQPGSWFSDSPFQNIVNPMQLYLISFYSATTTVTGIGFGDLTAVSRASMIICMIMIILGTLLFGYMSASIVSSRACIHTTLSQYQEMLNEMRSFMEHENIDLHIQTRFISHFEYEWKRTHGVQPHVIFENFHTALMEDVVLWMYEQTLKAVPLFEQVDHSFYRVIGKHLKQMHFLRGETVIRSNDVQSNIYIIHHGKVEVLSSYHEMMACMGPGGLFGNIGSVNASVCTVNIVANKNLVVLTISSEILYSVLKNYPEVSRKMEVILKTVKDFIMPNTIIKDDESDSSYSRQEEDIGSAKIVMKLFQVSGSPVSSTTTGGTEATVGTVITTSTIATFGTIVSTQPPVNYLWPQNWFKFAILPESPVYTFQAYLVLIAAYLNCIVVSYQLAFQDHSISMLVMNGCLELIFYFKIFLELHQAYVDKFGEYVVDYKKIHDRYFKNRRKVAIDVIANIPLEIFAFFAPYGYRMKCASILQMSHLHRFAYIIEFYRARAHLLVVNKTFLKMSSLYIWVTLLIHCTACMWYFISCPLGYLIKDSWADKYKVPEKDPYTAYITSVYFIAGLFTGTGYGDLLPCSVGEVTVCIFMMIASKFCVALFIGDITTVLTSYTSTLTHYEYGIYQLRDALHNQKLSSHQMDKMWNYVRQLWKRESGMQMPRLVVRAPFVMRCDLMNAAYGHHLRNSYVFSNTNEDFLRQLTVLLHHYVFFPGNYIVQQGDTDMNIYFIHRGEVDVLTVHPNLTETIHDVLKPNDMFGVAQGLFHGIPHHFSFRAKTVVDIVSLHLDSWAHLLEYFPEAQAEIYKRASLIYINV